MSNLMHLRDESSQLSRAFQNLVDLDILKCGRLKKLVSSSMSFQNLISLRVAQCHGMLSLLTSQTAKSMARLERLTICGCKRMTEIIADTEETDDMEGEIVFGLLKTLTLDYLPSLSSFYSVKYMIGFPDLESVFVNGCSEMQCFSKNDNIVGSQKLHKVVLDYDRTMSTFSSLINSTISHYWKSHPRTVLQEIFTDKNVGYDEEYSEGDDFDDDFEDD
ncbi:uncharacterized protein LOC132804997 [Ziziphus jujuba]|uniref:Uncharacterized protein LOC132804997 n=1 Tax=Ziziphus jujuba TaxID=326968 RepID=A0ABM4AFT8_ZIZJJ|nr:uncharacterized protein LOC132804997 [Ziziphus jujuba]